MLIQIQFENDHDLIGAIDIGQDVLSWHVLVSGMLLVMTSYINVAWKF